MHKRIAILLVVGLAMLASVRFYAAQMKLSQELAQSRHPSRR